MSRHSKPAGAILVGGGSRRMGIDKANLELHGQTLIQIAVSKLAPLASPLYLSGAGYYHPGSVTVPDLIPDRGPLGGILSVMNVSPRDNMLVLAVDTPLIRRHTLRRLMRMARDADIAVIRSANGQVHPLCGLYSKRCRQAICELVQSRKLRVDNLFTCSQLKVTFLDACDLGCDPMELTNINTPADLSLIRKFLSRPD